MQSDASRRATYALAAIGTVVLGLVWRSRILPLSPFIRKYGGDALWALLVYWLVCFCVPRMKIAASIGIAFGIAVAVEFSQLCHAPWIDSIRATRLGLLILGNTFNWPDIPAYAVGILIGATATKRLVRE
jgi:Protein of unknown function (DUF2809)